MSTYYESAEDIAIDAKRVNSELLNHGQTMQGIIEFFIDCKPSSQGLWNAQEVLLWLGY